MQSRFNFDVSSGTMHKWIIVAALAAVMGVTRLGHFGEFAGLPDASWAVFFLAGLWLADMVLFGATPMVDSCSGHVCFLWGRRRRTHGPSRLRRHLPLRFCEMKLVKACSCSFATARIVCVLPLCSRYMDCARSCLLVPDFHFLQDQRLVS